MKHEIIECKEKADIKELDSKFSDVMSKRMFPFTKGVPFCCAKIEHCIELFKGTGKGDKPEACNNCKLKKWCDYSGESFKIKAITECDKDLLAFLEERDENIDDWF